MKFKKITAGCYVTEDGRYGVMSDGYSPGVIRDPVQTAQRNRGAITVAQMDDYGRGGEWAAVHDVQGRLNEDTGLGDNLDWFPTKKQAIEFIERRIAKQALDLARATVVAMDATQLLKLWVGGVRANGEPEPLVDFEVRRRNLLDVANHHLVTMP